ncbi:MAG: SpoVA/SpoVAEb family sporulation membrane protein [Christensenellaceae bacterium]|nr:SpoVA/SpoVAEb family sporulation membrane protein [Christensenellaceae bacterium]
MLTFLWSLVKAFVVGGLICVVGEVFVLKTKLTPARILVGYIVAGVILSAVGIYGPIAEFAGAGASVPLTGFGHALTTGVKRAIQEVGFMGAFTGGLTNTAAGIAAAVFFGSLVAMLFKPKAKQ